MESSDYGHAFGVLLRELGTCVDQRNALCVLLILEKARGDTSVWAPYIDILPQEYDDPYWWSSEELGMVQGTRLGRAIEEYRPGIDLISSWTKRLEEIQRSSSGGMCGVLTSYREGWALTSDAARWARSTVWSRAFTIHRLNGPGPSNIGKKQQQGHDCWQFPRPNSPVIALVPVLDMIDHDPDVEAVWHTGPEGIEDFQFCPFSAFSKGSVMRNNYGCKTNDELILAYGFTIKDNSADHCLISLAFGSVPLRGGPNGTSDASSFLEPSMVKAGLGLGAGALMADGSKQEIHSGPAAAQGQTASASGRGSGEASYQSLGGEGGAAEGGTVDAQHQSPMEQEEDVEDEGDARQQKVESLQRDIALAAFGLAREHRLSLESPLPSALVLSARLCLLPPGDLYSLTARQHSRLNPRLAKAQEVIKDHAGDRGKGMKCVDDPVRMLSCRIKRNRPDDCPEKGGDESGRVQKEMSKHQAREGSADDLIGVLSSSVNLPSFNLPDSAMRVVPLRRAAGPLGQSVAPPSCDHASSALSHLLDNGSSDDACPAALPALVLLRQQLLDRLQKLVPEDEAMRLLRRHQGPSSSDRQLCEASDPKLARHVSLALTYVRGQRRILTATLQELERRISNTLLGLQRLALPVSVSDSANNHGSAFEIVPSLSEAYEAPPISDCMAATPSPSMVFGVGNTQHLTMFTTWMERIMSPLRAAQDAAASSPLALKEVLCLPKADRLAAASRDGSRGQERNSVKSRRPIASVTLRSLRHHTGGEDGSDAVSSGEGDATATVSATVVDLNVPTLPSGISAALGLDMMVSHDPLSWGAVTTRDLQSGDLIAEVPEDCALIAGSRVELLGALLVPAHALLQELVAHAAGLSASADPLAQRLSLRHRPLTKISPREMLVLHLMHTVGASPAARLPATESDQVSMLLEMLDDSPAGSAYQDASEAFKSDFEGFRASVTASALPVSFEGCSSSNFSQNNSKDLSLAKVMAWPGAFGLFCWATEVIERCAIQGAAHNDPFWAVMPLASAVPPQLREAALRVELMRGSGSVRQLSRGAHSSSDNARHLRVLASCSLPSGLLLAPALLVLQGSSTVEGLMETMGPEALVWRKLLALHSDPVAASATESHRASAAGCLPAMTVDGRSAAFPRSRFSHTATLSTAEASASKDGSRPPSDRPKSPAPTSRRDSPPGAFGMQYELFISPSEEDPWYQEKLELLTASGLGTVHYLTDSLELETEVLVLGALKVCLADETLLMHPLVHKVVHLYQTLEASRSKRGPPKRVGDDPRGPSGVDPRGPSGVDPLSTAAFRANADLVDANAPDDRRPEAMAADPLIEGDAMMTLSVSQLPSNSAPEGSRLHADQGSPDADLLKSVQSGQQHLLEMLELLPADHEAAVAAGKQLRQIVADARKHARRRLRQIDTQQERLAAAAGSGGGGAGTSTRPSQAVPPVTSVGLDVLRQGIRQYLEELVAVLDRWARHLGLENKLEPSGKKQRRGV